MGWRCVTSHIKLLRALERVINKVAGWEGVFGEEEEGVDLQKQMAKSSITAKSTRGGPGEAGRAGAKGSTRGRERGNHWLGIRYRRGTHRDRRDAWMGQWLTSGSGQLRLVVG
jgi:hypothetical protein